MNDIIIATTNTILDCAAEKEILITPLKLQKLLYINYGSELVDGHKEKPYMSFEAWTYGPVLPMIYHAYKHLGGDLIRNKLLDANKDLVTLTDQSNVEYVIRHYGHLTGTQLIDLLHRPNGAWWKAFSTGKSNTLIKHSDIKDEFTNIHL